MSVIREIFDFPSVREWPIVSGGRDEHPWGRPMPGGRAGPGPRIGEWVMSASSSPLQGGLIGCGYVSQYHLDAWREVPGARLVALCDVRPDRLAWAVARAP